MILFCCFLNLFFKDGLLFHEGPFLVILQNDELNTTEGQKVHSAAHFCLCVFQHTSQLCIFFRLVLALTLCNLCMLLKSTF